MDAFFDGGSFAKRQPTTRARRVVSCRVVSCRVVYPSFVWSVDVSDAYSFDGRVHFFKLKFKRRALEGASSSGRVRAFARLRCVAGDR